MEKGANQEASPRSGTAPQDLGKTYKWGKLQGLTFEARTCGGPAIAGIRLFVHHGLHLKASTTGYRVLWKTPICSARVTLAALDLSSSLLKQPERTAYAIRTGTQA